MLTLKNIEAGYGTAQVLFGVSLAVAEGQCVSLLGRNGMGKTTTIRTIMGELGLRAGSITRFDITTSSSDRMPASYDIARAGFGLVPEGRQIFPNLSVAENLKTFYQPTKDGAKTHWNFAAVLDLFPRLGERLSHAGTNLSGGEQQMLAIGRALMTNPRLLILDEATEGLAPLIRRDIWRCLRTLKDSGQAILIVDKNIAALAQLTDHHYILDKGQIVWDGSSDALISDASLKARYLGV
ncbi:ABC transporter ATP-binding protein [Alphaproteobacteria bacterium]|jgi:branched-chain amino acid transport system ATP-binding protein|nr:ABC transporter ATP-binding protein [Alphaproteobacteria bacterium]